MSGFTQIHFGEDSIHPDDEFRYLETLRTLRVKGTGEKRVDSELGIVSEAIRQKLLAQAGIHGDFDTAWGKVGYKMDRERIGKIGEIVRSVEPANLNCDELYDTSHMPQNVRDGYALLQSMNQEERIQWYDDLDAICGNRLKFDGNIERRRESGGGGCGGIAVEIATGRYKTTRDHGNSEDYWAYLIGEKYETSGDEIGPLICGIQVYDVPGFCAKVVHLCSFYQKMGRTKYDPEDMRKMIQILHKNGYIVLCHHAEIEGTFQLPYFSENPLLYHEG